MKVLSALVLSAVLCFAAAESKVSRAAILAVEHSIHEKFDSAIPVDPFYVLGDPRGTYLEGYGALFTTELNLVNDGPLNPNPFKPTITKAEITATRERKLKNLAILRDAMRTLILNSCSTLDSLAPNERIAMETILFSYSWEDNRGIPHRLFMSAEKQKLAAAKSAHAGPAELAAVIEEQER
ncbi:MAG: hypothetical protein M3N93_09290 [Acidobacteriota bacterium]|nr:hypothetical protein [Acidobacteriota bacterium]